MYDLLHFELSGFYSCPSNLSLNPNHDQRQKKLNLLFIERFAFLDTMPLLNASPATGGRGMLGDEHRMPFHRCLFAVIFWKIRRHPGIYKLKCMVFDGFETFGCYVIAIFLGQPEF